MNVILYPNDDNSVAIMSPSGVFSDVDTARRDVPMGKPYLIVSSDQLPQDPPSEDHVNYSSAWTVDFSNPDGYGEQGSYFPTKQE